ncbi:MAG: hypothetical protein KC619_24320 [Myxococcales bacterium]|nr:hypothetical protein [Myxococcales bacterium]
MATRKPSQTQQTATANPFAAIPGMEIWRSMMESQNERFEQMIGELERLEKERHDRALSAIDDMTKLVKSSIDYQTQLSAQWRELGLEAAKKSIAMMQAPTEA